MDSWISNSSIKANVVDLDITTEHRLKSFINTKFSPFIFRWNSTDMLMVLVVTLLLVATAQSNKSVRGK
jgi:hypothetical protein